MYSTQNQLLLDKLMAYYNEDDRLDTILPIINGKSLLSIRIIDWFVTNYAKKYFTVYFIDDDTKTRRFKVYTDYKLKLKAYSKKRFDPFCRWDRIHIPYKNEHMIQTTIGQLNFFKSALDNKIIDYINEHTEEIETDMNNRNSSSKKNTKKKDLLKLNLNLNLNSNPSMSNTSTDSNDDNSNGNVNESKPEPEPVPETETETESENDTFHLFTNEKQEQENSYNEGPVYLSKSKTLKTRKKREELSSSAVRSIKKEDINVTISFS